MTEETLNTAAAEETTTSDSGDTIEAKKVETIFVNLYKNVYEKDGKNLISYKPGYQKKDGSGTGTYPVGFGRFHIETDWDFTKNVYERNFWLTVEVSKDAEKGDIKITLQDVDSKEYQNFYLVKGLNKDQKVTYKSVKPLEIEGTKYRANLSQNTNAEKPHLFNLVFKDAGGAEFSGGVEEEISFGEVDF